MDMAWIKVPQHEDYEINENGEVRFLGKTITHRDGRVHTYPPRVCKNIYTKTGLAVSCDGELTSIAKNVAELFVPNPNGYKRFYHIDGDCTNNKAVNIAWGAKEDVVLDNSSCTNEKEWLMTNYEVTTDGRVIRRVDGVELASTNGPKGYRQIRLKAPMFSKNKDHRKPYKIHRLVAMYHLPDYSEDLQVNHINGDKADNRVENLEMVTNAQNATHAWRMLDSTQRREMVAKRNQLAGRKVRCVENGVIYSCADEAAKSLGLSRYAVYSQLTKGVKNPRRKLHFEYV